MCIVHQLDYVHTFQADLCVLKKFVRLDACYHQVELYAAVLCIDTQLKSDKDFLAKKETQLHSVAPFTAA